MEQTTKYNTGDILAENTRYLKDAECFLVIDANPNSETYEVYSFLHSVSYTTSFLFVDKRLRKIA